MSPSPATAAWVLVLAVLAPYAECGRSLQQTPAPPPPSPVNAFSLTSSQLTALTDGQCAYMEGQFEDGFQRTALNTSRWVTPVAGQAHCPTPGAVGAANANTCTMMLPALLRPGIVLPNYPTGFAAGLNMTLSQGPCTGNTCCATAAGGLPCANWAGARLQSRGCVQFGVLEFEASFNLPPASGAVFFAGTYILGCANSSVGCDPSWNEVDMTVYAAGPSTGGNEYHASTFISNQPWSPATYLNAQENKVMFTGSSNPAFPASNTQQYRNYKMVWTPSWLAWMVDNVVYRNVSGFPATPWRPVTIRPILRTNSGSATPAPSANVYIRRIRYTPLNATGAVISNGTVVQNALATTSFAAAFGSLDVVVFQPPPPSPPPTPPSPPPPVVALFNTAINIAGLTAYNGAATLTGITNAVSSVLLSFPMERISVTASGFNVSTTLTLVNTTAFPVNTTTFITALTTQLGATSRVTLGAPSGLSAPLMATVTAYNATTFVAGVTAAARSAIGTGVSAQVGAPAFGVTVSVRLSFINANADNLNTRQGQLTASMNGAFVSALAAAGVTASSASLATTIAVAAPFPPPPPPPAPPPPIVGAFRATVTLTGVNGMDNTTGTQIRGAVGGVLLGFPLERITLATSNASASMTITVAGANITVFPNATSPFITALAANLSVSAGAITVGSVTGRTATITVNPVTSVNPTVYANSAIAAARSLTGVTSATVTPVAVTVTATLNLALINANADNINNRIAQLQASMPAGMAAAFNAAGVWTAGGAALVGLPAVSAPPPPPSPNPPPILANMRTSVNVACATTFDSNGLQTSVKNAMSAVLQAFPTDRMATTTSNVSATTTVSLFNNASAALTLGNASISTATTTFSSQLASGMGNISAANIVVSAVRANTFLVTINNLASLNAATFPTAVANAARAAFGSVGAASATSTPVCVNAGVAVNLAFINAAAGNLNARIGQLNTAALAGSLQAAFVSAGGSGTIGGLSVPSVTAPPPPPTLGAFTAAIALTGVANVSASTNFAVASAVSSLLLGFPINRITVTSNSTITTVTLTLVPNGTATPTFPATLTNFTNSLATATGVPAASLSVAPASATTATVTITSSAAFNAATFATGANTAARTIAGVASGTISPSTTAVQFRLSLAFINTDPVNVANRVAQLQAGVPNPFLSLMATAGATATTAVLVGTPTFSAPPPPPSPPSPSPSPPPRAPFPPSPNPPLTGLFTASVSVGGLSFYNATTVTALTQSVSNVMLGFPISRIATRAVSHNISATLTLVGGVNLTAVPNTTAFVNSLQTAMGAGVRVTTGTPSGLSVPFTVVGVTTANFTTATFPAQVNTSARALGALVTSGVTSNINHAVLASLTLNFVNNDPVNVQNRVNQLSAAASGSGLGAAMATNGAACLPCTSAVVGTIAFAAPPPAAVVAAASPPPRPPTSPPPRPPPVATGR